jgi:RNA polymerase sigma-70 factor (ECF subfamily)
MDPEAIDRLVNKARQKEPVAFDELVEQTRRFAFDTVYRITGSREDSRDIMQEAYIRLWRSLHSYNGSAPFTAWFRRILRNLAIDWLRRKKGRQVDLIEVAVVTDTLNPSSILENKQLTAIIRDWIPTLPRVQQKVFIMRDMEGLSVREVKEESGFSESAIKTNLYHARQKLRLHLLQYGYQ